MKHPGWLLMIAGAFFLLPTGWGVCGHLNLRRIGDKSGHSTPSGPVAVSQSL
jgi:hypothetical protein